MGLVGEDLFLYDKNLFVVELHIVLVASDFFHCCGIGVELVELYYKGIVLFLKLLVLRVQTHNLPLVLNVLEHTVLVEYYYDSKKRECYKKVFVLFYPIDYVAYAVVHIFKF